MKSTRLYEDESAQHWCTEDTEDFILNVLERTCARESCLNLARNLLLLPHRRLEDVEIGCNVTVQFTNLWDAVGLVAN